MSEAHPILLTVVVPYRNDDGSAGEMLRDLAKAVSRLVEDYEIIVIDNGSTRDQYAEYGGLIGPGGIRNVQIYRLLQSADFETAAVVGIENSLGDYILVHDPRSENLSRLADALQVVADGREVVFLRNEAASDDGIVQRLGAPAFRWLFKRLTKIDLARDAATGRLFSKRVATHLLARPRAAAQYRTFPYRAGFAFETLTYRDPAAARARTGTMARARSALRLIVANSMAPIRLVSIASLFGALLNVIYSVYVVVIALVKEDVAPGWVTLSLQQSGMFLLITLILFALTEYLIQALRWSFQPGDYFIDSEMTSTELSRLERINVGEPRRAWQRVGGA